MQNKKEPFKKQLLKTAKSTEAEEYTDCICTPQRVFWYDIKLSDGEAPVMLEIWVILSTSPLPSFPGPLWLTVVAPDRVLSMGQIELFDHFTECKQMTDIYTSVSLWFLPWVWVTASL